MAEINEFDDQLKDTLSNLGNDISPGDWDSFAEKLNVANGLSPLNETAGFDDLIRERMESLEVTADANYWEVMESKIDQELNVPEISDEAVDQLVTDNLSNLYIPYNPTHWTLMSNRLEEEFNVRRKIVNYKVAEFSLMVLLLLTIVQFMPSYPSTIDKNVIAEKQPLLSETNKIADASTNMNISASANSSYLPQSANERASNTKVISGVTSNTNTNSNPSDLNVLVKENNIPSIISSTPSQTTSTAIDKPKEVVAEEENTPFILENANHPTDQLALFLADLPVSSSILDHTTDLSEIGTLKKFSKKVMIRLGAMTSADFNNIKTPSTSRQKDNSYQQYRLGYGGGITMDLNYEKLTLSTGLIYRRINYYPQEDINIAGSFANGYRSHVFDAVNLNLLTIPMNLQFQVNNPDKKWKLHAVTGASINVLALTHYNVTVNNLGRNNNAGYGGPAPSQPDAENSNTGNELVQEADVAGEGLFEGGSFQRNHYFTANFGIGVERFISPRWSLFIQPIYQHEIFGKNLGLNRDRIHTFSIEVGAKSTFK